MNLEETAELLAFCAAFDARTVGNADVIAWNGTVGWVSLGDARTAVAEHYTRETDFIKPAHVIAIVKRVRRDRAEHADASFVFEGDPDDTSAYCRALDMHRRRIADGAQPPRQPELTVSVPPQAIADTFRRMPRAITSAPVVAEPEPWSPPSEESKARARAELIQAARDAAAGRSVEADGAA